MDKKKPSLKKKKLKEAIPDGIIVKIIATPDSDLPLYAERQLMIKVLDYRDGVERIRFLQPMTVQEAKILKSEIQNCIEDIEEVSTIRSELSDMESYLDSLMSNVDEARNFVNVGDIEGARSCVKDMDSDFRDLEDKITNI